MLIVPLMSVVRRQNVDARSSKLVLRVFLFTHIRLSTTALSVTFYDDDDEEISIVLVYHRQYIQKK